MANDNAAIIPNVVHMDLREAYKQLRKSGFKVKFGPEVASVYRRYARGLEKVHPGLWVAEIEPPPGLLHLLGNPIVIRKLECSNRLKACD